MSDFGKRQQCKKAIVRNASGKPQSVVFTFRDGDEVRLSLDDVRADMMLELAAHGAKQKIGDEGAKERVTNAAEFAAAARAMIERIYAGTAFERVAGAFGESDLARALAEFKGATVEAAAAFLKDLKPGERAKLRIHPGIKAILDRLAEERAGDGDPDELLEGFAV